ncbi:MAG: LysM peptidoglycan-binding domain-containing protein [Bacilli bacterium]
MSFGGGDGSEVIYALRNNSKLSNLILDNMELVGQEARKAYQRRLPSDTSKDYYFIHRNTGVTEPVIVEYGFLDSTEDDVTQLKNNWKLFSEAVVKSVMNYKGLNYVPIASDNIYIVKSGDSLWSIAKSLGVTVDELKEYNNLTTNALSIGQVIQIPTIKEVVGTYVVKSGDTLYSIAKYFNLSVDELVSMNNLVSNTLSIGQVLKVTNTVPSTETENIYTVKSGDNLYSIAASNGISVSDLMAYNNLTSTSLSIGQILKIPTSGHEVEKNYTTYTVKSGDSLWTIANKYGLTTAELMAFNNMSSSLLSIGQVLKIPTSIGTQTYIVKSGDNLYSIASKYNTSVDSIKSKNNLKSNALSIGQVLLI